ncbi:transposable element Tc1 transposase [Trichonephila clavipes]|nr:transposable element Tc1 transposase [Trichonephila clavipes]
MRPGRDSYPLFQQISTPASSVSTSSNRGRPDAHFFHYILFVIDRSTHISVAANAACLTKLDFFTIDGNTTRSPPPQFRHGTGGEGNILQLPALVVSAATTHKTFGPTDITSTYSVYTQRVDRSENAVRKCWEQWTREGTHARKTGSGATRKTTRREDRRIVRQSLVDPTVTRSPIRADVGLAIVPQTISRHLAEANVKSKRPFRALPLTPQHRQLRLQWCQAKSMLNVTDWQKVLFSDESRFVLGADDNRVRMWRRPGESYNSPHTVLRHPARTAGVAF